MYLSACRTGRLPFSRLPLGAFALSLLMALGACGPKDEEEEDDDASQSDDDDDDEDAQDDDENEALPDDDDDQGEDDDDESGSGDEDDENDDDEQGDSGEDDEDTGTTTGAGSEDSSSDDGGGAGDDDPGDATNDYCKDVAKWDPQWAKLEAEILQQVNEFRAKGATCGLAGKFEPAGPVTLDAKLRCAARVHSKDMGEKNYFDHQNKEGESPFDRIKKSGFVGRTAGENIAAGNTSSEATMAQWIKSDGHCSNMMNPKFTKLGVGYYPKPSSQYRHYWTQNFGG